MCRTRVRTAELAAATLAKMHLLLAHKFSEKSRAAATPGSRKRARADKSGSQTFGNAVHATVLINVKAMLSMSLTYDFTQLVLLLLAADGGSAELGASWWVAEKEHASR